MKSVLTLEEPESFQPWLGYLFKSQQDCLMAVVDKILEDDDVLEVSSELIQCSFSLNCDAVLFPTHFYYF